MSPSQSIPLTPIRIAVDDLDFQSILTWPFADDPFYEGQVKQVLDVEFRRRYYFGTATIWIYRDPNADVVGFGTLDLWPEYPQFTSGQRHCYIPVIGVNPGFQKRGHGRSIVKHLVAESVLLAGSEPDVSSLVFLDVYTANQGAIGLYQKCGFTILDPDIVKLDPAENNEPYVVMAVTIRVDSQ